MLGQYYDQETGLHYNYHRYYDPKTGRYLTPDPIGQFGGINLFVYAQLNPINATDPWGLETIVLPGPVPLPIIPPKTPVQQAADKQLSNVLHGTWMNYAHPPLITAGYYLYGGGIGEWVYDITHPSVFYGPSDQTSVGKWKQWAKERDKKLSDETVCETRTPWQGPGKQFDPNEPPKGPWWKKLVYAAGKIAELIKEWPK